MRMWIAKNPERGFLFSTISSSKKKSGWIAERLFRFRHDFKYKVVELVPKSELDTANARIAELEAMLTPEVAECITLSCPYCGTELHQNERMECKCGWIAEAISDGVYNAFLWQRHGDYEKIKNIDWSIYPHAPYTKVYHINSIHWLELKDGKAE